MLAQWCYELNFRRVSNQLLVGPMLETLKLLNKLYGPKYLFSIFCYHHVLKGFVLTYVALSFDFVMRSYHVPGPRMQLLKTVVLMPWAFKPLVGVVSDLIPIMGYRKAPYLMLSTLIGASAFGLVAVFGQDLGLAFVVAAFFAMFVQITTCDLLLEAATAERIQHFPEHGPALISYVTGGTTVGEIIGTATVGVLLERSGPFAPCTVCTSISAFMMIPAVLNLLAEERELPSATTRRRSDFMIHQREILYLVAAIGVGSVALVGAGVSDADDFTKFVVAAIVSLFVISLFYSLLSPTIGMMICFFFLQSVSTISLDGGTFYFFTDDAGAYPMGPHFSIWFYTSGLGVAASTCGLLGLAIYNQFMTTWKYRSLFLLSNSLWCCVSCFNVLVYTRRNLDMGIPDRAFVLGGAVLQNVFERWAYVPGGILLSQVCPKGIEATMFALLAGCLNLGRAVAGCSGALLLSHLGVQPNGTAQDSVQFTYLWQAAVVQASAPLITLLLVPQLLPDARQTDRLIDDSRNAATANSPWSRWQAGFCQNEDEDEARVLPLTSFTLAAGLQSMPKERGRSVDRVGPVALAWGQKIYGKNK